MKSRISLFIFLLSLFFAGCEEYSGEFPAVPAITKGDTVKRTLLIYMMAENSLSRPPLNDYAKKDMLEIKRGAMELDDNSRLFLFIDNNDTTALPAIYQYHKYNERLYENKVFSFEKDVCSSDTTILGKVLDVLLKDYPTKELDLIMWSHSSGWVRGPEKSAPLRSIGIDNEKNSYFSDEITTTIEMEELACLLERLPLKVDRLMFDACFMQCVEVAYALRNSANWIIASPAEIPGNGAPYEKMVPAFFTDNNSVEDIMDEYKEEYDTSVYGGVVLSAVKLSEVEQLANTARLFVEKYISADNSNSYNGLFSYLPGGAYNNTPPHPSYYDINAVMKSLLASGEYETWRSSLEKAVPCLKVSDTKKWYSIFVGNSSWKTHLVDVDMDVCCGVSMYLPQKTSYCTKFNRDFRTTEWYEVAGFDKAGW